MMYAMPTLYCPFPPQINPNVDAIDRRMQDWIQQYELFSVDVCRQLPAARYAELVARAFPTASHAALELVTDWNVWLFARDDFLVETEIGAVPDQLVNFNTQLLEILHGREATAADLTLGQTLADFCRRLRHMSNSARLTRFIQAVENHFQANVWEAVQYNLGHMPDLSTYRMMRPFTGAMYTELALIEIADQFELACATHQHPLIQSLNQLTCQVVCFANDLFSLTKEANAGETMNLVCILQHEHGLPLQEAVDRAAAIHNSEVRAFEIMEAQLPACGLTVDADVRRYIDGLHAWMRGNLDWSITSGRYNLEAQLQAIGD
jgi:5-epi-alpha-selinene synthase